MPAELVASGSLLIDASRLHAMAVQLKSRSEIAKMRRAGALVARVLREVGEMARPGVTTEMLDQAAARTIRESGAVSAFLGYPHPHGGPKFPATLCISVNEVIVHGIPSNEQVLREGDIVSVDCGVRLDGFYGDAARTFPVGRVDERAERLLRTTEASLHAGIEVCRPNRRMGELSGAIEAVILGGGFSIVRDFVGHGVGRKLHEEPQVPNYVVGERSGGLRFREGLVLAIEPMVNEGEEETETLDDQWTVVTRDRSRSAHFEHSVAITAAGPQILTVE